jgi:hypothetical protein
MANYRLRIGHPVGFQLAAEAGSYALTGQTSGLTYTPAVGAEPYIWYNGFDKQLFLPHVSSGVWGPQSTVKEAIAPTGTMVDVTAATVAEMEAHIYTPNRRITLTGDINGGVFNDGNITDVDIIVPTGRLFRNCFFGAFDGTRNTNRLRIRGSTVGSFSGGQIHQLRFFGSTTSSDLIIDGLSASGPGGNNGAIVTDFTMNRMAITNVRAQCGGYFYIGTAANLTVTGCSILTGVGTVSQVEAWGIRCSHETIGNVIVFDCDIRSSTNRTNQAYHRFRCHPDTGLDYVWVYGNTFIDRVQSRIFWIDAAAGSGTGDARGAWFQNNLVIAASTDGSPPAIEGGDTAYAYIIDNDFQSNTFLSNTNIAMSGITLTDKTSIANTYAALPGSDPVWGGAGDPTGISWNI